MPINHYLIKFNNSSKLPTILAIITFILFSNFWIQDFPSLLFYALFSFFSYAYLYTHRKHDISLFLLWVTILIPATMSLYLTTEILICDEFHMIRAVSQTAWMQSTDYGAFWTTHLFHAPLRVILRLLNTDDIPLFQMHKAFQWFLVMFSIVGLWSLWNRFLQQALKISQSCHVSSFLVFWYGIVLLPVVLNGTKILGYNIFSLLFGLMALIACLVSLNEKNPATWAGAGVILGYLSAQEKNIGGLVLMLSCAFFFYALLRDDRFLPRINQMRRNLIALLTCFGLPLFCSIIKFIGTLADHHYWAPRPFHGAFDAMTSWTWVMYSVRNFQTDPQIFHQWTSRVFPLSLLAFMGAVMLLIAIGRFIPRKTHMLTAAMFFVSALAYPLGYIVSTYWAPRLFMAWAPIYPIASGHYTPPDNFNSVTLYYGALTSQAHRIASIKAQLATYFGNLPVILIVGVTLAALFLFIFQLFYNKRHHTHIPHLCLATIFILGLIYPVAFGLAGLPPSTSYLNFAMAVPPLLSVIPAYLGLNCSIRNFKLSSMYCLVFCIALLGDLFPFRPFFFNYRSPLIDIRQNEIAHSPAYGRITPWWLGGEEAVVAARLLNKTFEDKPVNLFVQYYGDWQHTQTNVFVYPKGSWNFDPQHNNTDYDFILYGRLAVAQHWVPDFPQKTKPWKIFSANGFEYAWLFRASDLAVNNELPPKSIAK